jgi:hypothetical protein
MTMARKNRGNRPSVPQATFGEPLKPASHNDDPPSFCLRFLQRDFDVHALNAPGQAAFAKTLQKLSASQWKNLVMASRHGQGTECIPRSQIKAPVPPAFQDQDKFLVFRYNGMLSMGGVRVDSVFHVLWIEPGFGRLYDHG